MKSRDEIIDEVKGWTFSARQAFFGLLDRFAYRSEGIRVAWPDALQIISREDWNHAYEGAKAFREAQLRGEKIRLNEKRIPFSASGGSNG